MTKYQKYLTTFTNKIDIGVCNQSNYLTIHHTVIFIFGNLLSNYITKINQIISGYLVFL